LTPTDLQYLKVALKSQTYIFLVIFQSQEFIREIIARENILFFMYYFLLTLLQYWWWKWKWGWFFNDIITRR